MQPTSSHFLSHAYATIAPACPEEKQGGSDAAAAAAAVTTSSSAPPPSTMSWQERGDFHLQRKEFDLVVEAFTKLLEQGEAVNNNNTIATGLKGLGHVFMEKEQWTFSAKLINGAYALLSPDSPAGKVCLGLMVEVERRFLQKVCGINKDKLLNLRTEKDFLANREQLQANRQALIQAIRKGDQSTAQLFAQYSENTADFLDKMVTQLYPILGKPPCKYALVGLGSLARREMSPYSDLEFALLIKKNTPKHASYFRHLVKLLELEVIHLGETEIKVLNHGLETPTKRGFSFDDGGNTPLGKEGYVELLGTPQELARFQTERFFAEDLILSNVLKTVSRLVGDNGLCKAYLKETAAIVACKSQKPPLLIREDRAFTILQGHLVEFEPRVDKQKEESPLFNVKAELYRLPNMLISGLADYYGIQEGNTWDKIAALQKKKIISEEGANNLKKALDAILHLRARTHLHYKRECDDVFHPSIKRKNSEIFAKTQNAFTLSDQDVDKILEIYRVLFPLHRCFQKLSLTKNFGDLLSEPFYDDSPLTQGQAHQKLHQYTQAKSCFQTALAFNPSSIDVLLALSQTSTILAEFKEARGYAERAVSLAQETNDHQDLEDAQYLNGLIALNEGDNQNAVLIFERLIETLRELYGNEDPYVATCLNDLGSAWLALGEAKKAIGFYEEAFRIRKKLYGNEHPDVALCHNNFGMAWISLGDAKKAVEYFEAALRIGKIMYGNKHPKVATMLNNLGGAWHTLGEAKKASSYYEEALHVDKKVYGEEHPHVARGLNNLGAAWQDLGNTKKAVGYYEEALRICKKVYGEEHPDVALWLNNLSSTWQDLGDTKKALSCREEALEILRKVSTDNPGEISTALYRLGNVYKQANRYAEAITVFEEMLDLDKKVHGKEHPEVVTDLNSLGSAWEDLGNVERAVGCREEALEILRKVSADNPGKISMALYRLGNAYKQAKRYPEAIKVFEEMIALDKKVHGPIHKEVSDDLCTVGIVYQRMGLFKKAEERLQESLAIDQNENGDKHERVSCGLNYLGNLYRDWGRLKESVKNLELAGLMDRELGESVSDQATGKHNLGLAFCLAGRYLEGLKLLEEAFEFHQRELKPQHLDLGIDYAALGLAYRLNGQWEKSSDCLQKAGEILKEHPAEADRLGKVIRERGELLLLQQKWEEAERELKRSLEIWRSCYDEKHYEVVLTEIALAEVLLQRGDKGGCERMVKRALAYLQEADVVEHPQVGRGYRLLGICTGEGEWFEKALQLHRTIQEDHLEVAMDLVAMGRREEAVAMMQRLFPEGHPLMQRWKG